MEKRAFFVNKYGELATLLHQKVHFLSDFKISELTVTEIEECKTLWFYMIRNLLLEKTILQKLKTL